MITVNDEGVVKLLDEKEIDTAIKSSVVPDEYVAKALNSWPYASALYAHLEMSRQKAAV
jgi:hypothetical protein